MNTALVAVQREPEAPPNSDGTLESDLFSHGSGGRQSVPASGRPSEEPSRREVGAPRPIAEIYSSTPQRRMRSDATGVTFPRVGHSRSADERGQHSDSLTMFLAVRDATGEEYVFQTISTFKLSAFKVSEDNCLSLAVCSPC